MTDHVDLSKGELEEEVRTANMINTGSHHGNSEWERREELAQTALNAIKRAEKAEENATELHASGTEFYEMYEREKERADTLNAVVLKAEKDLKSSCCYVESCIEIGGCKGTNNVCYELVQAIQTARDDKHLVDLCKTCEGKGEIFQTNFATSPSMGPCPTCSGDILTTKDFKPVDIVVHGGPTEGISPTCVHCVNNQSKMEALETRNELLEGQIRDVREATANPFVYWKQVELAVRKILNRTESVKPKRVVELEEAIRRFLKDWDRPGGINTWRKASLHEDTEYFRQLLSESEVKSNEITR